MIVKKLYLDVLDEFMYYHTPSTNTSSTTLPVLKHTIAHHVQGAVSKVRDEYFDEKIGSTAHCITTIKLHNLERKFA